MSIHSYPIQEEILTPDKYLKLTKSERASIREIQIIPPKVGTPNFGKIRVKYKNIIFRTIDE